MNIPRHKYIYAVADFIVLMFAFIITQQFVFFNGGINGTDLIAILNSLWFFGLVAAGFLFIFQSNNLYKHHIIVSHSAQIVAILKSLFYGTLVLIVLSFTFKVPQIYESRVYVLFFLVNVVVFFIIVRVIFLRELYLRFGKTRLLRRNLLIIGAGKSGRLLATKVLFEDAIGVRLFGFIDDAEPVGSRIIQEYCVIGTVSDLPALVVMHSIREVIIAIDNIEYNRLVEIVEVCQGLNITTKVASELFNIVPKKMETELYGNTPVVDANVKLDTKTSIVLKRIFDFVIALTGLIIFSPFFLLLALIIKLSSKGPIFYTHERIGFKGKPFQFYKFRSMTQVKGDDEDRKKLMVDFIKNGKTQETSSTKIINHARVTWIGNLIRKFSLDEFPQLINVVKGNMSLVGPRPCLPYEYEQFEEWQKKRHDVLPGCTGVWQVFGRGEVSFKDSVILDLYYINNLSPWLDLQLLIKTIPVLVFGKGK
ncbi:MAG: sugar transferase [Melioribacteraceae bacterium]